MLKMQNDHVLLPFIFNLLSLFCDYIILWPDSDLVPVTQWVKNFPQGKGLWREVT